MGHPDVHPTTSVYAQVASEHSPGPFCLRIDSHPSPLLAQQISELRSLLFIYLEETAAPEGDVTCPRSVKPDVGKLGLRPGPDLVLHRLEVWPPPHPLPCSVSRVAQDSFSPYTGQLRTSRPTFHSSLPSRPQRKPSDQLKSYVVREFLQIAQSCKSRQQLEKGWKYTLSVRIPTRARTAHSLSGCRRMSTSR